jgi:hypothetical protein
MRKLLCIFLLLLLPICSFAGDYTAYDKLRLVETGSSSAPAITQYDDPDTGINFPGSNVLQIICGGVVHYTYSSSSGQTVSGDYTITSPVTSKPVITYTNTNADANTGSTTYYKNSSSPTINDGVWNTYWKANDSSGNADIHAQVVVIQTDETTANEDCTWDLDIITGGTLREYLGIGDAFIVLNEDKQDIDFRYENTTTINGVVFDYGIGGVGINKVPASGRALDVVGAGYFSTTVNAVGGVFSGTVKATGGGTISDMNFKLSTNSGLFGGSGTAYLGTGGTWQLGLNGSGLISIGSSSTTRIKLDGATGKVTANFFTVDPCTVSTNATTNATITPTTGFVNLDTWHSQATSTVNYVTTANIAIGQLVVFQLYSTSHSVVFLETGNLYLNGAAVTYDDPADSFALRKISATSYKLEYFFDNN